MSKLFKEQVKQRQFKKLYFLSGENLDNRLLNSNFFLFMSCKNLEFNSYFSEKVNDNCVLLNNVELTNNLKKEKYIDEQLDDFSGVFENELNSLFLQYI